jgi:nucleotide-binding universal stress UspA family protein
MFKKILVPTDGSEYAAKAEDLAISLAKKLVSEVIAVHVIDEKLIYPYEVMENEGNEILAKVHEKGKKEGVSVKDVLIFGDPRHDMNKIALKSDADLIVIGSHGRTGLERLLMGSVADTTLKTSEIPVLLVK